jgi:NIMA-interacting peptidyl-prolyl cis-trans isomerase 1
MIRYEEVMMRLSPMVFAVCFTACGGSKPEAKESGPVGLTAGEGCLRDAKLVGDPPDDAPEQIDVVHIVVKHDGVKGAVEEGITRNREDACLRATEARAVVLSQSDWDAAYKEYSDDQGPSKGVIHGLKRGGYDNAFSNAAFSMSINDVSYVVETKRGFHVILRTR